MICTVCASVGLLNPWQDFLDQTNYTRESRLLVAKAARVEQARRRALILVAEAGVSVGESCVVLDSSSFGSPAVGLPGQQAPDGVEALPTTQPGRAWQTPMAMAAPPSSKMATLDADAKRHHDAVSGIPTARMCVTESEDALVLNGACIEGDEVAIGRGSAWFEPMRVRSERLDAFATEHSGRLDEWV